MIKPAFPFKEKQIILTSNRVMIHSNSDAIFLFGKGAVSLSSPQTINLDSKERVLINSPKIELGRRAEDLGDPIVKGTELTVILLQLLNEIQFAGMMMKQCDAGDSANQALGASMQAIANAGDALHSEASRLIQVLGLSPDSNPILSNVTFTR